MDPTVNDVPFHDKNDWIATFEQSIFFLFCDNVP